jgi:seryl-tRNA synthetase
MDNNKTKAEFINDVQKWVAIDTQLKSANEKIRQLRDSRNQLTSQICGFVDAQNMRDTKLEISDGNLKVYDRKEYAPLTFGYIETSLDKIIPNKEHVEYILKYLKENREITTVPDIRRNITK